MTTPSSDLAPRASSPAPASDPASSDDLAARLLKTLAGYRQQHRQKMQEIESLQRELQRATAERLGIEGAITSLQQFVPPAKQ